MNVEDDKDEYVFGEGTKTLEFSFKTSLDYDTSYSISIDSAVLRDYEGISTDLSNIEIYNFRTVADIYPPEIVSIDPSYNNSEVIKDLSMIEIVFNDTPLLDLSSSFYLYDITNDVLIEEIDISNDAKYKWMIPISCQLCLIANFHMIQVIHYIWTSVQYKIMSVMYSQIYQVLVIIHSRLLHQIQTVLNCHD